MTSTFEVSGMTCAGCAAKVKYALEQLPDVTSAMVGLEDQKVTVEARRTVQIDEIAKALAPHPKYTVITAQSTDHVTLPNASWQTYWPLILIGLFVSTVSAGTAWSSGGGWMTWMEHFMGGFFLVFSFFKLLDLRGFANNYQAYDLLARAFPAYGFAYPFLELGLGMGWAFVGGTVWIAGSTLLLMGFSAVGVILAVSKQQTIQCACLGTVFNLPMSTVTIIEDLLMVVMAAAVLFPLVS